MKRLTCVLFCLALLAMAGCTLRPNRRPGQKDSVTWEFDDLKYIGGIRTEIIGNPKLIDTPNGRAVEFDGVTDALLVSANPIASAETFTVEAVFRPDHGGNPEQRWFHIQELHGDNRVLLETRLVNDNWFLDTFIKYGDEDRTLYAQDFTHPLGQWYHVALVYDGSTMRHYVDGREELSGPLKIKPFGDGRVSIGMRMNRVYWFKGAVRTARFTPRALTPEQFMGK